MQRGFSRHHLTSENFMPVFKKILVPVDGSATSNKAVDFALRMAKDDLASIRLLHCIDETSFLDAYAYSRDLIQHARQAGQQILQRGEGAGKKQGW